MKKLLVIIASLLIFTGLKAQNISYIESTKSWYNIYDTKGKKTKTMNVSTVGKILSVSGDTFTSQSGSWIYTWSKDGKKISTKAAKK